MTQSLPNRTQAPGVPGASRCPRFHSPPRAAEPHPREPAEGPRACGEVHVWFASPSASTRYLDIVLARRGAGSPS